MTERKRGIFLHVLTAALLWQTEWICWPHRQSVLQQYGPIGKEQEKLRNHRKKPIEKSTSSDDREKTWNISSCLGSSFVMENNGYTDHLGKVCFQQSIPRQGTRKASQSSHKTDRKLNFVRWQRENVEYFFMSWQQLCCGKHTGYADHIGKVCFQQYGPRQANKKSYAIIG